MMHACSPSQGERAHTNSACSHTYPAGAIVCKKDAVRATVKRPCDCPVAFLPHCVPNLKTNSFPARTSQRCRRAGGGGRQPRGDTHKDKKMHTLTHKHTGGTAQPPTPHPPRPHPTPLPSHPLHRLHGKQAATRQKPTRPLLRCESESRPPRWGLLA